MSKAGRNGNAAAAIEENIGLLVDATRRTNAVATALTMIAGAARLSADGVEVLRTLVVVLGDCVSDAMEACTELQAAQRAATTAPPIVGEA